MNLKIYTNLRTKCSIVFVALFFITISPAHGQTTSEQIYNYLHHVSNQTGAPGISVAVALQGQIIFSGGVGYGELDNLTPATGATVHNIASISKTHAAVAVMLLVEQGKVNLDDPIQKYVFYFPQKKWQITVRHILTHSSGIRHYKRGEFGIQNYKEKIHYDSLSAAINIFTAAKKKI